MERPSHLCFTTSSKETLQLSKSSLKIGDVALPHQRGVGNGVRADEQQRRGGGSSVVIKRTRFIQFNRDNLCNLSAIFSLWNKIIDSRPTVSHMVPKPGSFFLLGKLSFFSCCLTSTRISLLRTQYERFTFSLFTLPLQTITNSCTKSCTNSSTISSKNS